MMFSGVCTGIAAYFDIDVTIVRIIFLALLFVTKGAAILAYFALSFVIPEASTQEERAAAHGAPFNAQELLEQAKRHAEQFAKQAEHFAEHGAGAWRQHLHEQKRLWREQRHIWKRNLRQTVHEQAAWARGAGWWGYRGPADRPVSYTAQVWAGILVPLLGLISLTMFLWLAFAVFSLVTTGAMFGWALPAGIPLWAGILILIVLYQMVTSPIRAARHASYYAWGRHNGWFALWDGVFAMAVTCLVFWLVYHYVWPVEDFRHFIEKLPDAFHAMAEDMRAWIYGVRDWLQRVF
jgi:phage shock protein PspC (stress-responsive transcriptional regulator)